MNALRSLCFVAAAAALMLLSSKVDAADGPAPVVERVVAVVHNKVLLLSELRAYARPFIKRLRGQLGGKRDAKRERMIYQQLLVREVEYALLAEHARANHIKVGAKDVDKALTAIAAQQKISVAELLVQVRTTVAMSEKQYRAEIRRQVLEGKVIARLLPAGARSAGAAADVKKLEAVRRKLIAKLRRKVPVNVRVSFR